MFPTADIRRAHAALLADLGGAVTSLPARHGELLELGRLGPLPCWSMSGPPALATSTARGLARRGRPGLLMADETASRRRTLVVSIPSARPAVVTIGDLEALPLIRLRRMPAVESLLGTAIAVAAALDVDAAGRRAFRTLRRGIDGAIDRLDGRIRRDIRHAWVLLQVTRLLFLRFVESEGWLGGDPVFLRRTVDEALRRGGDPESRLLHPLFFGTLNREPATRSRRAREFGAIPFLNGGLFEPHPLEREHRWRLPVEGWRDLFALTIERVEVTLDADDPGDRVNPELLGRVFEGMMHPDERRAAGTFYTPPALVVPIVREAYACHLAPRLERDEARILAQLDDPDPALVAALLELRVLDPAVGSGAFLVGALQVARGPGPGVARRTRHLVARRLFGVDRNPVAVRLTELRLWLEVLRTMRGRPIGRIAPLPNLDTAIRAGDALLDPLAGAVLPRGLARHLAAARRGVVTSHGAERRRATSAMRALEREAMRRTLRRSEEKLRAAIAALLEPWEETTLFGERAGLPGGTAARLASLRRAATAIRGERRRLATADAAPIFAIESAFAPELARGGFDLVLGNPPWVRAERLPAPERAALAARYRWWRGSGAGWRHLPDVSVAFLERAVGLLSPGGTLAYLLPAKIATAQYAATCRAAMNHRTTMHVVADLSCDPRADFQATTYPMAVIASRRPPIPSHRVRISLGGRAAGTPQLAWRERSSWNLTDPGLGEIAASLAARHPPLAATVRLSLGLKTGANAAFLDPPEALRRWTRPVLRGRDIAAGEVEPTRRMLWPADDRGQPWPSLPEEVAVHLAPYRSRLERRADHQGGPWWQFFRTGPATARWRVVWPDLARALRPFALDDPEPVPLNTCYVIACRSRDQMLRLTAWLRAAPIRALARIDAEPAANDYRRFGARAVGGVPFPEAAMDDAALLALAESPETVPEALDRRVAELLGLDPVTLRHLDAVAATGR